MRLVWQFLTDFGDTAVTVPLALLVLGFLLAVRELRLALGWALVMVGCAGAIAALKLAFSVCGYPLADNGLASPSGHTAMSFAVYGGLAAVVGSNLQHRARNALIAATAAFTIGIALSRTIVGHHTAVEVIVGLGVGIAAIGAMIAATARWRPARLPLGWLLVGAIVVIALFHGSRWPAERAIHQLAWWFGMLRPYCS